MLVLFEAILLFVIVVTIVLLSYSLSSNDEGERETEVLLLRCELETKLFICTNQSLTRRRVELGQFGFHVCIKMYGSSVLGRTFFFVLFIQTV